MKPDFSLEYAHYIGYQDGREYGTKNPHRSFERGKSKRDDAYFAGLENGIDVSRKLGLDNICHVKWDNPGFFDSEECGKRATHIGTVYNSLGVATLNLCDKHAKYPGLESRKWSILPNSWL